MKSALTLVFISTVFISTLAIGVSSPSSHAATHRFKIRAGTGPCRSGNGSTACDRISMRDFDVEFDSAAGAQWHQELVAADFSAAYFFYVMVAMRPRNGAFLFDVFINDTRDGTPLGAAQAVVEAPDLLQKMQVQSGLVRLNPSEAYRAVVTLAPTP